MAMPKLQARTKLNSTGEVLLVKPPALPITISMELKFQQRTKLNSTGQVLPIKPVTISMPKFLARVLLKPNLKLMPNPRLMPNLRLPQRPMLKTRFMPRNDCLYNR